MNIYKELPDEMKDEIDKKYYNTFVRPLYNKLMAEVIISPYRCEYCDEHAVLFDIYGNVIDLGNICLTCSMDLQNELEYEEEYENYEIGSTTSEDIGVEEVNEGI